MELKDFISGSLTQIRDGLAAANEDLKDRLKVEGNYYVMRPGAADTSTGISFDVAITTKTDASGSAEVKAKILVFEASAGGKGGISNETVSRLRFHVELKQWMG